MDFGQLAIDTLRDHAALTQSGIEVGRRHKQAEIRALIVAYDKALADPATKIPTYLQGAIEALRS
jgi:polygalacturonase